MSVIKRRLIATDLEGWNSPGMAWVATLLGGLTSAAFLAIFFVAGVGLLLTLFVPLVLFAGIVGAFAKLDDVLIAG